MSFTPDAGLSAASPTYSEVRFRELFEQGPGSIQLLDPEGYTLRVNKAWEALWHIHEGSDVHRHVLSREYNVLRDPQVVAAGISSCLRRALDGESVAIPAIHYDTTAIGVPGRSRWVTARAHPIKDGAGRVVEVMLMHEDITEHVEAETALREREERFRTLAMASSQIVWTSSSGGLVLDDSPSWRAYTGQSYEEWKEFGWLDAVHADDRERAYQVWMDCVASRSVYETEYRLRRADGLYRWTAVKGIPILDGRGGVREWVGANRDIHDSVMAQEGLAERLDREQRQSALLAKVANASRTLHTVLSVSDIAEVLVQEVRALLDVHQAVVSLTEGENWTQAINAVSLSEKYAAYRSFAAPTEGSGIYAEVCRTNTPMRLTQAELEAHPAWKGFGRHAAGHPVMRGWLAVPLINRKGRNIGLIQVSDKVQGDFTEQDEAILVQLASIAANGFENARLYGSLREQDRRKDEFLAMLAHELRNPLAPIATAAELLKMSTSPERIRASSEVIARQVRHMTSLVDDLLDVSRVTRGLIKLDRTLVAIGPVLASAVEQSRPLVAARGHALRVDVAPELAAARVHGDATRLVQVVANLLNNAAKYTPSGGTIVLGATPVGARLRLCVEDNGIGIEAALLPQVFDLFTQAERTPDRSQGGLGIGLALVRTMVALHGGEVQAHSDGPGKGSTFTVWLPLA
ncbi:ATP-binding protein [Massilia sp. MS-15]|uniref:PAS domain-containing sensor histidine kinase n=1 Tax=Massilia sp. MS-15 TaxID=2878200 RepID=UPI001CD4041E|nr:ATP-binding protein [Massilia sp. MS-15]MCA1246703.1 PAS domain S-box protein [Massilia sp. MS-15]